MGYFPSTRSARVECVNLNMVTFTEESIKPIYVNFLLVKVAQARALSSRGSAQVQHSRGQVS